MSKNHEESYIPTRNPRDINVVDRINNSKKQKPIFIDDEDIQSFEVEHRVRCTIEESSCKPGGPVTLNDSGLIDPQYLPPSAGGATVYQAATHYEFPTVGDSNILYIATSENNNKGYIYRWCDALNCYEKPYDSLEDISVINGGDAST